jgi:hypothetical protein
MSRDLFRIDKRLAIWSPLSPLHFNLLCTIEDPQIGVNSQATQAAYATDLFCLGTS